ncbi:MAG: cytochrome c, partial [Acidobacteria bacterium]|nr:cytochrome c [Acidobacteriota bacterium]
MRTGRVLGLATVVTLVAAACWGYRLLATRSFSAREKPTGLEAMLARHARRLATSRGVRDLQNPLPPTPLSIAEARDHFADH